VILFTARRSPLLILRQPRTGRLRGGHTMQNWLAWAHSSQMHGWDQDVLGYAASALVLATFCMKSMRWLRASAIASNFAFILYALVTDMRPILILHTILLPVNIYRLAQVGLHRLGKARTEPVPVAEDFALSD
jgi:hypothetical protein